MFLTVCFALLAKLSFAQLNVGLKGGVTSSKIYTDAGSLKANFQESLENRTGFVLGAYARVGKKLFFQPEVLFASKGGKVDVTPLSGGTPLSVNLKTNSLDVPLLLGYKLLGKIRIMAGPVATFKLSEDQKFADQIKSITGDTKEAFANATFGYQAGVGIRLLGFDIDLRKEGSLGAISSKSFNEDQFNQRIDGWQLTLARKIF